GLPSALRALREGLPCQKQPFQQRWCHHACVEAVLSVRREGAAGLPIRALIVSDRDVVRAGVAAVLRPYPGRVKVTGTVGLTDALTEKASSTADVVIFDAGLAGGDGLDEVDQLTEAWGDHRVVVLASPDEARFAQPVLQRGAAAFLLISIT